MIYTIHTEETVHGSYKVKADSEDEARQKFKNGDVGTPDVFEALSAEIETIEVSD